MKHCEYKNKSHEVVRRSSRMGSTEPSLKQILNEILNSKTELRNAIETSETRLRLDIELMGYKIKKLEEQNEQLHKEIEQQKRTEKKNSLIIHGLKLASEITIDLICSQFDILLEVNVTPNHINDIYRLGKDESSPVKVEFIHYWKKQEILKNSFKLKGKKIFISNDLTKEQLEDIKILRKHWKIAKENNQETHIRRNELHVDGNIYTPDELRDLVEKEEELLQHRGISSAPSTPILPSQLITESIKQQAILPDHPTSQNTPTSTEGQTKTNSANAHPVTNPQTRPKTRLQENRLRKNSDTKK